MWKKGLVGLLIVLAVGAGLAWANRVDILLGLVKFRTEREYTIAPNRPVPWQQGPASAAVPPAERPPNIILIVADDLGINDLSTFGGGVAGGRAPTPNIDKLAQDGARFEQAYAGTASCAPSRAMLLTGRYPTRTGFEFTPTPSSMVPMVGMVASTLDNGLPPSRINEPGMEHALPYDQQGLPADEVTIAKVLQARGYHTVHIGKWHLGRSPGFAPNDHGFDESLLMTSGLYLPEDDPEVVNAKLDFDPIDRFLWARMAFAASYNNTGEDTFAPAGYLTDYWTDESIKVIQANKHQPFFLYLAHWGPHTPLQATREDYEAVGDIQPHRLRVYAAMIRALDRSVGRIMTTLEAEGLAENTVVVFTSDNGGAGYIGLPEVNAPYRGWKLTMFEGGIRVPFFVHWPARIAPGTEIEKPAAHIDVMPTIASAAQAPLPADRVIDGVDLLPLTGGQDAAKWSRDTLFWQSGPYRVVRHGDWKLQVTATPAMNRLYDLAADPTEQNNLAEARPDVLAKLQGLLEEHQASARKPLYPYVVEMPIAVDKTLAEPFVEGDAYIYWPN